MFTVCVYYMEGKVEVFREEEEASLLTAQEFVAAVARLEGVHNITRVEISNPAYAQDEEKDVEEAAPVASKLNLTAA